MNLSVDIRAAACVNMNFDIVYVCFTFFGFLSLTLIVLGAAPEDHTNPKLYTNFQNFS